MNYLTLQIKNKGWTLTEFLNHTGFSLRWYRYHSHVTAKRHEFLVRKINELECK